MRKQGLKLRDIKLDSCHNDFLWDRPLPSPGRLRFWSFREDEVVRRMSSLRLKGCTALSFRWNYGLVALATHASNQGHASCTYLSAPRQQGVSIYAPLDYGEVVDEVWQCKHRFQPKVSLLVSQAVSSTSDDAKLSQFTTSKGRIIVAGPYQPSPRLGCRYDLLARQPDFMFFDENPRGITTLALESLSTPVSPHRPGYPVPESPYPRSLMLEEYFYTSAKLDNIARIIPCRQKTDGKPSVTGILLQDSLGHWSCVGQVCVDNLSEAIEVGRSSGVNLHFAKSEDNCPYVEKMELKQSERDIPDSSCIALSWCGLLEWWVSRRQCLVHYGEQSSPATRISRP